MMTPEQQLTAIIEAQVKGGCDTYEWHTQSDKLYISPFGHSVYAMGEGFSYPRGTGNSIPHDLLRILFDPAGLRAAYGETFSFDDPMVQAHVSQNWEFAANRILDAWLSKPDGDAIGAIKTAYELLPKA